MSGELKRAENDMLKWRAEKRHIMYARADNSVISIKCDRVTGTHMFHTRIEDPALLL